MSTLLQSSIILICSAAGSVAPVLVYLASRGWFGASDLAPFVLWTVPFALLVLLSIRIFAVGGRQVRGAVGWARFVLRAIAPAFAVTVGFWALLGPWMLAWSFPVFWCWLIGGLAGHVTAYATGPRGNDEASKGIGFWKGVGRYAGVLIVGVVGTWILGVGLIAWQLALGWDMQPGARMPSGSGGWSLRDDAADIVYVDGSERMQGGELRDIRLSQTILVYSPDGPRRWASCTYSSSGGRPGVSTRVETCHPPPDSQGRAKPVRIEIVTDARSGQFVVGELSFDLSAGNTFVVFLDEVWNPILVEQVPGVLEERKGPAAILEYAKTALPNNLQVRSLQLRD